MDVTLVRSIREDMERAEARRLQPHFIASFFLEAFKRLGGAAHEREPKRYEVKHVPAVIRNRDRAIGRGQPILPRYERITFEKTLITVPGKPLAAFVCPGHPLLDATIDLVLERHRDLLVRGAVLVDEATASETPRALLYLEHSIQDARTDRAGNRRVVSRRLQFVEVDPDGTTRSAGWAPYLDYRPLADELQPARNDAAIAGPVGAGVLDRVFEVQQSAGRFACGRFINQDRSSYKQVTMAFQHQVDGGVEKWMARTHKRSQGLARNGDKGFLESDSLVPGQDWLSSADGSVPIANDGWDVLDLIPLRFPFVGRTAETFEGFQEKGRDEVGLKPASFGTLHVLANGADHRYVHGVMREGARFQELSQPVRFERAIHRFQEPLLHLRLVAITDGFQKELTERPFVERDLSQHVENLAAEPLRSSLILSSRQL